MKKGPKPPAKSTEETALAKALEQLKIDEQTKRVEDHCLNIAYDLYETFRDINFQKASYTTAYKKYHSEFQIPAMTRKIMANYFKIAEGDENPSVVITSGNIDDVKLFLSSLNGKIHYVKFMIEKISIMNPQYEFFRFGVFPKFFEHIAKGICTISNALGNNIVDTKDINQLVALAEAYLDLANQYGNQYLESLRASLNKDAEKLKKYPSIAFYKESQWEGYSEYFCVYYYFAIVMCLSGEHEKAKSNAERAYEIANQILDYSSKFSKFKTLQDFMSEFDHEIKPFVDTIKGMLANPSDESKQLVKVKELLARIKASNQQPQRQLDGVADGVVLGASKSLAEQLEKLPKQIESRNDAFTFLSITGLSNQVVFVKVTDEEYTLFKVYLALFDHLNDFDNVEQRSKYLDGLSTLTTHWIILFETLDSHVGLKFATLLLRDVEAEIQKAKKLNYVPLDNGKEEVEQATVPVKAIAVSWRKQAKLAEKQRQKEPQPPRIIQAEAQLDKLMPEHQATIKEGFVVKKRKKQKKVKVTAVNVERRLVSYNAHVEVFKPDVFAPEVALTHEVVAKRVQVRQAQVRKVDMFGTIYEDVSAYKTSRKIDIDARIKKFMEKLAAEGFQPFVHGGAVRDRLLNLTPNDWDLRMQYSSEAQIPQLRKHLFLTAKNLNLHLKEIEGREGYFKIGKKIDFTLTKVPIKTEALTRDITINAFFADYEGHVYAPMDNISDIDSPFLMAIGDFEKRIKDDPRIIFRLLALNVHLNGLKVIPAPYMMVLQKHAHLVQNLPLCFLKKHLADLFLRGKACVAFSLLNQFNLLAPLMPGASFTNCSIKLDAFQPHMQFISQQCHEMDKGYRPENPRYYLLALMLLPYIEGMNGRTDMRIRIIMSQYCQFYYAASRVDNGYKKEEFCEGLDKCLSQVLDELAQYKNAQSQGPILYGYSHSPSDHTQVGPSSLVQYQNQNKDKQAKIT